MKFLGIIPARYSSTRFPGKPLVEIKGKSMIQRVFEQASKSKTLDRIIVATDDQRIFDHVMAFGGNVMMTNGKHQTGTDRCAEIVNHSEFSHIDVVINIQGDEPFINPIQIDQVAECFNLPQVEIATLIKQLDNDEELLSNSIIKVIRDSHEKAIYFSRVPIPYLRNLADTPITKQFQYFKHIGIYAYRKEVLLEITKLKQSSLELAESLEQLRWLENGYSIQTCITEFESHSVDLPSDLEKF